MNDILPKEQWTKPEDVRAFHLIPILPLVILNRFLFFQDVRYLAPHVEDVHKEDMEREVWDNISVQRRRK